MDIFKYLNNLLIFKEYLYLIQFGAVALIVSLLLFGLSVIFVYQKPDKEKMSVYECGFNPYGDARNKFEVKYYVVGILFIIFDLEIIYVFPWVLGWWELNIFGIYTLYLFIFLLTLGFIYDCFWVLLIYILILIDIM